MVYDADVIVVGAGPAGSMASYVLATQGVRVIILEKNFFPRYKVCGGGLTYKILGEIPFDLTSVIETTIHSFRFSHNYSDVFTRYSPTPLMYCAMRNNLDAFLLQQAIDAGAKLKMGEQVRSFKQDSSGVSVITDNGQFLSRLLIGAEGVTGIVSRTAGLNGHIKMGLAWEAEVTATLEDLNRFSGTVFLDWGTIPGGYAWVFPKKDHFSIGVGGPSTLSKIMMPYYDQFMESISLDSADASGEGIHFQKVISKSAWPIPVRTKKSGFQNKLVLVAGDSAGLGDPLTGEGIYYAVRSGKLAAEACCDYISGKIKSLDVYSERVNEELMTELLEADRIKHIFNIVPLKIHLFVRKEDRAWRAFGKILRGERWYADVRNGLGKWKYFWKLTCFLAGIIERFKEKQARRNFDSLNL
ncbi:MAG: geranylgeranyl reductase family protein [Bacteroidales bacterium]|jgi:geranylgeranyl reductase family protein